MGTRAAFWMGDPRDIDKREWLGSVAWDGYPGGFVRPLLSAKTPEEFRDGVTKLQQACEDFASPDKGWPFPWDDDIFLTDYTYALFDGGVRVSRFHSGFVPAEQALGDDPWPDDVHDPTCCKVPAGKAYDRSQPDSILMVRM